MIRTNNKYNIYVNVVSFLLFSAKKIIQKYFKKIFFQNEED